VACHSTALPVCWSTTCNIVDIFARRCYVIATFMPVVDIPAAAILVAKPAGQKDGGREEVLIAGRLPVSTQAPFKE